MKHLLTPVILFLVAVSAPADEPFNGHDLKGWKFRGDATKSKWKASIAMLDPKDPAKILADAAFADSRALELVNTEGHSVDIYTEAKFGDCVVETEVMVPKGSNSGIYLMGEYEVQVFDSWGKKPEELKYGDMGGIYNTAAPRVNASKKPGEWQKFVIEFRAPRFEGGKKTENAKFLKVTLNDQVIHENVEVAKPTTACLTGKESEAGPIMLQGDHGPVAYRNLVVKPVKR
jgi:Domain of Unknown Function (DUF1080)